MGRKAKRCAASHEDKKVAAPAAGGASSSDDGEGGGTTAAAPTGLPMTNLVRLMRQAIPKNAKIAKISSRAKDLTHDCALEFVGFLAGEAVERATAEHRRTIAPEDFTCAFQTLGFDDYVRPMSTYISRYREQVNAVGYRGSLPRRCPPPPPPPATTVAAVTAPPPCVSDEKTQRRRRVSPHGDNDDGGSTPGGHGRGYTSPDNNM